MAGAFASCWLGAELVVADINLEGARSGAPEVQDSGGTAISVGVDLPTETR